MKKLNIYLINEQSTIKNAIIKIRKNGARTLVVINKKRKLLGTISEGDIQKSILKNIKISTKITDIYNKEPKKISINKIDKKKIKKLFLNKQYGILPIVDGFDIVKKIITWDDIFNLDKNFFKFKNIDVVIMAGGKGERLKPLTEILPKPLVPINNKPMLEHVIEGLIYFNFNKFFLILNHQADLIKTYFLNNYKNLNINYIKEKKPLGTAGGINLIEKKNKSKDILIANCDTLFKINYADFYYTHKKEKNILTLAVSNMQHIFPYGFCEVNSKKLVTIKEKPKFSFIANTGLYFADKSIIKFIPKNKKFEMTDLIKKCLTLGKKVGIYKIPQNSWTDLGQLSDFKKGFEE